MVPIIRRAIAAAFPDDEADLKRTTCVCLARSNAKSTTMGVLAAATVIPSAPLHANGRENFIVAGSLRQGRIVKNAALDVIKATCGLGPVNTYLSASKMSTKWMKPMNITSSFSNRENIRR